MAKRNFSIGYLEREAYFNTKIGLLRDIYENAQSRISKQLSHVDLTETTRWRSNEILTQIRQIIRGLNGDIRDWTGKHIPYGYERGFDIAAERLKILGVTNKADYTAQIHTSSVNILIDQTARDMLLANQSIRKNVEIFILRTQQKIINDNKISKMIAEGLVEGRSRRSISDTILSDLKDKLGNEEFIKINGKNYQPKKYAELVARTRMREATTKGIISTSLQYGNDLVQWSVHGDACDECRQFLGRVYSISGGDPDFPKLEQEPPVHPHCACIVVPATKEFLQERLGEDKFNNLIDLSNSDLQIEDFSDYQSYLNEGI
jgi:hypothetical protein